jgi:hypothetical protein
LDERVPKSRGYNCDISFCCQPILLERPTYLQGLGTVPTLWFAMPTHSGSLISWYRCGPMWLQHAEDSLDVEMSYVVDRLFQNWGILIRLMHLLQMSEFTAFPDKDNDRPCWKFPPSNRNAIFVEVARGASSARRGSRFLEGESLRAASHHHRWLSFSKLRRYWLSATGLPAYHVISSE